MINLIMQCLTSSSMQVLWNGKPSSTFKPQRGIRQGDPLSPYIFVLCMERLSHMITAAVSQGDWKPIKMGRRGVPLSHLFFADDLIVFSQANSQQVQVIKQILTTFSKASGQKVNQNKTVVLFSNNISRVEKAALSNLLGFQQTDSLGRYLGVPLLSSRGSSNTYKYILERIKSKLAGWKRNSLSLAGRITLAKSVLTTIPFYTMQTILLPVSCCKEIEKTIRNFIWGKPDGSRGISLIKWKDMCQPLKNGGCGLLNLETQNKAFIAKLIFQLHSQQDAFWVRILTGKYGLGGGTRPMTSISPFWRNLQGLWQETSFHVKQNPGDGSNTLFWDDYWVGEQGPLKHLAFSPISESDMSKTVKDYLDCNGNWQWNSFRDLLPPSILDAIAAMRIPLSPSTKRVSWDLTENGDFTVKSTYQS